MNVQDICKRDVVTAHQDQSLIAAAQLMREKHIGYLVVLDEGRSGEFKVPIGVLTDRDIVITVLARGADPQQLTVGDVMTAKPVVARESDTAAVALKEMRRIGVRRLPVVNGSGQLTGVLALDDILDSIAEHLTDVSQVLRHERNVESALRP